MDADPRFIVLVVSIGCLSAAAQSRANVASSLYVWSSLVFPPLNININRQQPRRAIFSHPTRSWTCALCGHVSRFPQELSRYRRNNAFKVLPELAQEVGRDTLTLTPAGLWLATRPLQRALRHGIRDHTTVELCVSV